MAEEKQSRESGTQTAPSLDPAATELGLASASRNVADAFLCTQRELIGDQRHHLHEQFKQLKLELFEKRLAIGFKGLMMAVGLGAVIVLGAVVWNAAQADGLVVEALSVPPRFAQAGITSEVVADDLMNKVNAIRDIGVANSLADSKAVSRDRDEDIKVEIPETGVSLGQAWHYLRLWLGHERRVTGNLRDTGDGVIALTIVLEGKPAITFSDAANDLGKLEQQAAEHVFEALDPLNYSLYLLVGGRVAEAFAVTQSAAEATSDPREKSNAYSLLSYETERGIGDMKLAATRDRLAIAIYPKAAAPHVEVIRDSIVLGHDEEGLAEARAMPNLRAEDQPLLQRGAGFQEILYEAARERDLETGDFYAAQSEKCVLGCTASLLAMLEAEYAARTHDAESSRALMEKARAAGSVANLRVSRVQYFRDAAVGDWRAAAAEARAYAAALKAYRPLSPTLNALEAKTLAASLLAEALVRSGDVAGAWAAIDETPGDCYPCIRTRGLVAAADREWGRADYWFARAVRAAPSIPFAYADWGQALLARGDAEGAIAKFKLANEKGPHFADPLEGWGEALMAKNQSHLALAKFAEAEKYAPNWGRLHLKWGEALVYAGKPDEARAQFARAATLDLTPPEKSELASVRTRGNGS
jgi:tetratricopeptide (TPR) repeat protein